MIFKDIRNSNIFWVLLACVPILLFFFIFKEYAVNIPFLDDFTFFNFIPALYGDSHFWLKARFFFDQHNEHRILLDRIIVLAIYCVKGHLDYQLMMLVGNFFLLGILAVYYKVFSKTKLSFKFFVPLTFLIFHSQLWENSFWGMASIQNYGVILFVSILFYLISSNNRKYFYLSFIIAFMATYTSGNGIFASIIASILLLLQNKIKDFWIFSFFTLLLLGSYLFDYVSPQYIDYSKGVEPKDIIIGFFSFLGAVFDILRNYSSRYIVTTTFGLIAFIGIIYIFVTSIFKSKLFFTNKSLSQVELFLLGSILFILGTTMSVVISRVNFGQGSLLISRYRLYSILLFINLYYFVLLNTKVGVADRLILPMLIMTIFYNIVSNYQSYYDVVSLRKSRICALANDIMAKKNNPVQNGILVYQKPSFWFDNFLTYFQKPIRNTPVWNKEYSLKKYSDYLFVIENNTETYLKENKDDGVYLLLQSSENTYVLPTNQRRNSMESFLKTGKLWANGFIGDFTKKQVDAGVYQMGVWIQKDNKGECFYLNDSLSIK